MAFAQGSRTRLSYIKETTFGTTPATPTMQVVIPNSFSLNLTKQPVESNQIRSDRQTAHFRHGNRNTSGTFAFDMYADDFDQWLEAAFYSAFDSSGVMDIGTTQQYFTVEASNLDITQNRLFTGTTVSRAAFSIAPNQMTTCTMDLVGKDMTISGTEAGSSYTPATDTNQPFDSFSGAINIGGSPVTVVTSLDFSIDNSHNATFVVGSANTPFIEFGRANVSGSISAYLEDNTLANLFVDETETSMTVSLTDPLSADTYTFSFPRVKFNTNTQDVTQETSIPQQLDFVALLDDVTGTELRLTKS